MSSNSSLERRQPGPAPENQPSPAIRPNLAALGAPQGPEGSEEDGQALLRIIELFQEHLPRDVLAELYAMPLESLQSRLCATLGAHRGRLCEFFRGRGERFAPTLVRLWGDAPPPVSYLDIGCGDGQRTRIIAEEFGLRPEMTAGCDILDRGASELVDGFFLFDGERLSACADSSMDLITLSMVLHHAQRPLALIQEICRVLRPHGRLILREHDASSAARVRFLELFHTVMPGSFYMEVSELGSRFGWRSLLAEVGLRYVGPEESLQEDSELFSYVDIFGIN